MTFHWWLTCTIVRIGSGFVRRRVALFLPPGFWRGVFERASERFSSEWRFSSIVKSDLAEHFRTGAPVTLEFAFVAPLFRRAIRFAYREVVISSPEQKCLEWDVDYDGKYCTKYFRRMKFSGCQFPRIMSR